MAKKTAKKKQAKKKVAAKKKAETQKAPMHNMKEMHKEEMKWQAESDVNVLIRADEIKSDKARLSRAKAMAKKQAEEAKKVANKLG